MRIRTGAIGLGIAAAVVASLTACSSTPSTGTSGAADAGTFAQDNKTLIFATVPDQAGTDSSWKPLEDYIAKKTGLTVVFKPTTDYSALIAAAVAGQVDVASFSGLTYVQAVNKGAKLDVVSSVIASAGLTTPGYYSEALVGPKAAGVTKVADFKGKTVCFVDPNSTSGFLFPLLALKNAGIDVTSNGTDANGDPTFADFTAHFAGAHDKSVSAIASGQCDVGFAEDSEAEDPTINLGKTTTIDKQLVPGGPIVYSDTLPQSVKDTLQSALSNVTLADIQGAGITVTDSFTKAFYGALPETKDFYKGIYDICSQIPAAACAPTA